MGTACEAIDGLPESLQEFWQRYQPHFRSRTRNPSWYAYHYLSALLRMEEQRNFATIGRNTGQRGENIQHFMSNSPWPVRVIYQQVQAEIKATPELEGGALLVDESADAKAGSSSAGASRQHNGRLGKVDLCQVGVFLAYAKGHTWTWVDGELFLPEGWFTPEWINLRQKAGIPKERTFQTKIELAQQMIRRAKENGLPFAFVACDDLYGRSDSFRSWMAQEDILYFADVPRSTRVYLTRPIWGVPARSRRKGKLPRPQVLSPEKPVPVWQVAEDPQTLWQTLRVRPTERGELVADYAARRIWTLRDGCPTEEWLVMRRESNGDIRYSFSNAPAETPLQDLAWMEAQRYFVERATQDAKSELGWDEFQAIKYRAWEHQAALTVLSSWFVVQVRLDWARRYPRDARLTTELGVDLLPELSVANVRELLRAAMPLPVLTKEKARELVVTHLLNRTRSRRSRMRKSASRCNQRSRDPT